MRVRLLCFVLANLAFVSAGRAATQAVPSISNEPDAKELAAYHLTMDGVNKIDRVTRTMIVEMKKDPKDEPTDAERKQIEELEAKRSQLGDLDPSLLNDAKSLSEMEAAIGKFPPLAAALRQEGMAPREYATFMMAMVQAVLAAGMQKAGLVKALPEGINGENVKFVLDHQAELRKLQQQWEALGK
jgi:hypothetical protein